MNNFFPRVENIILPDFILKEKPGNLSRKNLEHPFLSVCGSSGNTAIASAACSTPGELQYRNFFPPKSWMLLRRQADPSKAWECCNSGNK